MRLTTRARMSSDCTVFDGNPKPTATPVQRIFRAQRIRAHCCGGGWGGWVLGIGSLCKGRSCDNSYETVLYPHHFGENNFQLLIIVIHISRVPRNVTELGL